MGLNINAVRTYAIQLFQALSLLERAGLIHADIKPDNILVSGDHRTIKLCDFGTAFRLSHDHPPDHQKGYLVSRYYRAPEIILGLSIHHGIDMWSTGTTLFELYTGKICFPGRNNNDMLKLIMEHKGPFSHKLLRQAAEGDRHFTPDFDFLYTHRDPITDKVSD